MEPLDALWHLLNLFLPAALLGAIAAAGAKLVWRKELALVPWFGLAAYAAAGAAVALLAGLVIFGRDGRIATYAAMITAAALTLWWRGFAAGSRRPHSR